VTKHVVRSVARCSLLLLAIDAAHAEAPSIDACGLLQPAQIETVIGAAIDQGVRNDAGHVAQGAYSSTCVWTIKEERPAALDPDAPLMGKQFVILNVMQWPVGKDLAKTFLDSFRDAATNGVLPQQPSPRNHGDEALWWGDGLAVRRNDVSFGVSVFTPPRSSASDSGSREERLAKFILQSLDPTPAVQDKGDLRP
jgi:hypothetical protein